MTENKISISIPMDDFNTALSKLQEVQTILAPYLVALSSDQRMSLPKMGDKTFSFVEKSMQFAQSKPELMPGFIDLTEWQKDVDGRN
ncbi:hypothetical protein C3K47_06965 [Solitalea longa]|uniref:Uncharacterized protein n=1 Tax=Solitalea longa TaxID=2079460 RepID=A0A2S5A4I8_9SPHI|nr:hypothetical protein [Solitalea longa]POY37498.1 hypothetical protein C3K47_06965 [Solitalea longa]